MEGRPWDLAEGARDTLRFVARRLPWAALLAGLEMLLAAFFARAGSVSDASLLSIHAVLGAFLGLFAGVPVGMTVAKGLLDRVRFVGWIPTSFAATAALLAVAAGTWVVAATFGLPGLPFGLLLAASLAIGALAAVARLTWADA